ncbi:MAG: choline-binding transcriptional repressor BetI [Paracoccaceae bacterium]
MPKVGQEPARRAALVSAAISEIGQAGSLDVTVGQIAKRAGMSTALAHYYFDSKNAIFLAAMRHILREFGASVRLQSLSANSAAERLIAIVDASLSEEQFSDEIVSAWLVFYVQAQKSSDAARLLRVYARRMHSNLTFHLKAYLPAARAELVAQGMAAMIDGIYIRHALQNSAPSLSVSRKLVTDYLEMCLTPYGASLGTKH